MTQNMQRLAAALADRYRIERELGAGGMATVYLAQDLKHDRKVALKVLKPELAAVLGADRFVVEIRTTASLQHPHILPLFDSGTADGFLYYVMPFIQGETLRDKLNRETQLGVDDAVALARDVADALDYAHRRGVIHRDIKPENILLHDGRPIVADFGIALAVSAAAGGRMTETGLSLGTPHYMSPEQATADKEITGRSDVYSLASVLYEMLAGQPPHLGGSAQQVIMKIIAEPVDTVTRYRKAVPPNVAAALAKALEKLPADRFESAKAFRDALSDKGFATQTAAAVIATAPATRWKALTLAFAAIALLSTTALVMSRASRRTPEPRVARYSLESPGSDSEGGVAGIRHVAISADGSRLAWIARDGTIWTRRRDALEAQKVETGEAVITLALSPDGRDLAFTRVATLFVTSLAGGEIHLRADSVNGTWGVHWNDDGYLYFSRQWRATRVSAQGGAVEVLTTEDSSDVARPVARDEGWVHHIAVTPLPAGRGLLFMRAMADSVEFRAWDARTRRSSVIPELTGTFTRGSAPVGYADGHVFSVSLDGTLWATAFDIKRLQAVSEPQAVQRNVLITRELPAFDISAGGDVIMATGSLAEIQLATVTLDGRVTPLPVIAPDVRGVRLSPDGRRVAYGSNQHTFVHDLSIGSSRQIVPWNSTDPVWSRDGTRIAVTAARPSQDGAESTLGFDGFEIAADGNGTPRQLFRHHRADAPKAWTPDGKLIAHGLQPGGVRSTDLFVISFDGDSTTVRTLLDAAWNETMPTLSRDGKWIAYRANPNGTNAIFVRRFPDAAAGVWQVSAGTGTEPMWSPDGRTLYYWDGTALVAARLRTAPDFAVVKRDTVLRDLGYAAPVCCHSNYDVLNDGSGFIMALKKEQGRSNGRLILIEGLLTELKRSSSEKR